MAITESYSVVLPNQQNSTGDALALVIEQFTGLVEGTLARRSLMQGRVPVKAVKGTATITNYAVGEATLQKLVPGVVPDGSPSDFSKISATVDTVVLARNALPLLDVFQTVFDARSEIATEHGKKIAKFYDQSFFIQALKAALLTTSPYGSDGHFGGTKITLGATADALDPAKLYSNLADMFAQMEEKDVDPVADGVVVAVKPAAFYLLMQAQEIVNGEYLSAEGNSVQGMILKSFGVPIVRTNNFPGGENISSHLLSNTRNSNAYNGDFTKAVAVAFSPRALLAGETIPLQSNVFFDDLSKTHFVDSWLSYAVTPNRPEFAAAIYKP